MPRGKGGKPPDVSASPHTDAGHTWRHGDATLTAIITGELTYVGRTMPAFSGTLSDRDIRDILASIKTWWGPERRRSQEQATRSEQTR